jgi:hypothetical protein
LERFPVDVIQVLTPRNISARISPEQPHDRPNRIR